MADDNSELRLMTDEEVEEQIHPKKRGGEQKPSEEYSGPERRSGKERRTQRDRRETVRFEPGEEKAERRSGQDRRKSADEDKDTWDHRDF
ncbi:hypothetical protein [Dongshaea marina]|uniref:hypothetical protein n=1 Tax=Dongshaea marina TaxID=2047966 RepID=UPI00190223E5|nr:hypothetical protein [Dongshaea marina]